MDTEKVHVDGISTFVEQYIKTIKQLNVLDPNTLQKIVINIELIHSWNIQFYSSLRNRLKKNLDKPFGDLFLHMVFISYCFIILYFILYFIFIYIYLFLFILFLIVLLFYILFYIYIYIFIFYFYFIYYF